MTLKISAIMILNTIFLLNLNAQKTHIFLIDENLEDNISKLKFGEKLQLRFSKKIIYDDVKKGDEILINFSDGIKAPKVRSIQNIFGNKVISSITPNNDLEFTLSVKKEFVYGSMIDYVNKTYTKYFIDNNNNSYIVIRKDYKDLKVKCELY